MADGAVEVEALRSDLARAKEQARVSNAAAEKAAANLKKEQATRSQVEERVSKIEQELKDATRKCKLLEEDNKVKAARKGPSGRPIGEVQIPRGSRGAPTGGTDSGW